MDIEPCPWCGTDADTFQVGKSQCVLCGFDECQASGPFCHSEDAAIAAWNRVAGQRWRPIETAPEDRRGVMIHAKPGIGATHWRPALEPPEPPPIQTSGYVEIIGKEPLP